MITHSATKLLFMGGEFAQTSEWGVDQSLDWHLLQYAPHKGIFEFIKSLNRTYRNEEALYEKSFSHDGFEWVESGDAINSVLVYLRKGIHADNNLIVVLNLTPNVLKNYRIGIPAAGTWEVILNSDEKKYYGSGVHQEPIKTENRKWMNQPFSAELTLPPLGGMVFKRLRNKK
jgi:1,4-alpha-glucan branching enzyme